MRTVAILFTCLCAVGVAQKPGVDDYQISGIMVDHLTNRPLNHVLVEITAVGKGENEASVLTEADGRFTFLHVPKGKYNLQAQKRGQFPQGFHSSEGGYATAIVVDGNLQTENLVFALRTDASINGIVMSDDGEPLRNAQVQLFRESVNDGRAQTVQANNTATNESGQFHLGHLEPGKYYLAVSGMSWYSQIGMNQPGTETVYPVTFYGDSTNGDAARAIALTEGASASVQIDLRAVPAIHVKVPNNRQNIQLSVRGPGGTEIPIPATLQGQTINTSGGGLFVVNQPQQGIENTSYELVNLPAGSYRVSSSGPEGEQGFQRTVDLTNGSTLSLDNSASVADITGRIAFDCSRPDEVLSVILNGGGFGKTAEVAADGTFKYEKVPPGKVALNLTSAALAVSSMEAKGARMVHDELEIPGGAWVELKIHVQSAETLASVDGFAVQGETGVAGAMVLLLPQDLARVRLVRRDQSDADGSFSLAGVLPGRYTLVAIDDGRDLAYRDEKAIKPYLEGGLAITIPLKGNAPLRVPIQTRRP